MHASMYVWILRGVRSIAHLRIRKSSLRRERCTVEILAEKHRYLSSLRTTNLEITTISYSQPYNNSGPHLIPSEGCI
jgi:hypothetical protein